MTKQFFLLPVFLVLAACKGKAQSYADSIYQWRQQYKEEFLADAHSPLKAADTGFLRFFEPDAAYCVPAVFTATPSAKPFDIATHSGKTKKYQQYGTLRFEIDRKLYTLAVYQGVDLIKRPELKDHLFIPFNDLTNYEETYGGGRYIDLRTGDIVNGRVRLDFNKCYNPYCAFAGGYSCPIPPDENKLQVAIRAGEQNFGKEVKE